MRSMRRRVSEYDVARWAASFLDSLNGLKRCGGRVAWTTADPFD